MYDLDSFHNVKSDFVLFILELYYQSERNHAYLKIILIYILHLIT